jgi:hypothetical protein
MSSHDIIDTDRKHYNHNYRRNYGHSFRNDHNEHHDYYSPSIGHYAGYMLGKVWSNRKLRVLVLLLLVVIVALIILALFLIIPLVGGLIETVRQEGLKGIFTTVQGFIEKLWNGK